MTDLERAREEYKDWKRRGDETGGTQQEADEWPYVAVKYADVLIAALEAENEALKWMLERAALDIATDAYQIQDILTEDDCIEYLQALKSRWTRRKA